MIFYSLLWFCGSLVDKKGVIKVWEEVKMNEKSVHVKDFLNKFEYSYSITNVSSKYKKKHSFIHVLIRGGQRVRPANQIQPTNKFVSPCIRSRNWWKLNLNKANKLKLLEPVTLYHIFTYLTFLCRSLAVSKLVLTFTLDFRTFYIFFTVHPINYCLK